MSDSGVAVSLGGIRAMIARRMRQSLADAAQISYFADADIGAVVAARAAWKAEGLSIGFEDVVIAALGRLVSEFPDFNAHFSNGLLTRWPQCDVSVAIAAPSGLVTPVVRDAGAMALPEIARQRRALVDKARAGSLGIADMKGGTITLSNLGLSRVRHFTPILNPPQVAIIGLGQIEHIAVIVDGALTTRHRLGISLTTDHQIVDGALCGAFLSALCRHLEQTEWRP
jgi:pyruvate dehydrogenase E2 component (dihydrolipoamide acetyltransferase)